jgi:hypothetical protein
MPDLNLARTFAYVLAGIATLVMIADLVLALRLKKALGKGEIGSRWSLLIGLLAVFCAGYVLSPLVLFFDLGVDSMSLLVFGVFLLGALFVWIVIGVLRDALSFLEMLSK